MTFLAALALHCPKRQTQLIAHDSAVATAMAACPASLPLQLRGLAFYSALATQPCNRSALIGRVAAVVAAMKMHGDDALVAEYGAGFLGSVVPSVRSNSAVNAIDASAGMTLLGRQCVIGVCAGAGY